MVKLNKIKLKATTEHKMYYYTNLTCTFENAST